MAFKGGAQPMLKAIVKRSIGPHLRKTQELNTDANFLN